MHLSRHQCFSIALALFPVTAIWLVNGFYVEALVRTSPTFFWIVDVAQWIVLPVMLLVMIAKKAAILPKHYGLDTSNLRWQSPIFESLVVFVTGHIVFTRTSHLTWLLLGKPSSLSGFVCRYAIIMPRCFDGHGNGLSADRSRNGLPATALGAGVVTQVAPGALRG